MGNMAKGTRVKYIGPHNLLKGLEGNISELERPNATGATVLWDNGIEYFNYWCELSILADAKPTAEASEPDLVNQPQHYQFFPDLEAIEVIARSTTQEQFYGYCLGNRLKYRLRAGNKDKLEQDIAKSDKYLELYEQYKGLCYGAGDEAMVPVPMPNPGDW